MKILLLNQTFHPDIAASAQYLVDAALHWVREGHEVTVVTARRAYDGSSEAFPAEQHWRGIRILRVPSTRLGKAARWRRAVDFASFLFSCAGRLLRLPRQDAVVALTSPPLISVLGALLAGAHRARFVYWVMDLNPDEAMAAGWLRRGSRTFRFLDALSRFSLRRADRVVALDRFMRDHILRKGVPADRIEVVPPWILDLDVQYSAEGRTRFRREEGLEGRFVVMYAGNHSPCHPLDPLLDAARRLRCDSRYVFCFLGGGSEHARIDGIRSAEGLSNVRVVPYQPRERLSDMLSAADLHVVVMGAPFVGLIHPCKIYNALAVGAPVVGIGPAESHLTDLARSLTDDQRLRVFPPEDSEGLVAWIRAVCARTYRPGLEGLNRDLAAFLPARLLERLSSVLAFEPDPEWRPTPSAKQISG